MIKAILLVGLGGGLGSILRFLAGVVVTKYFATALPVATFLVNVVGCFLIGLLIGLFERYQLSNPELRFLFVTGFCGGFTTFSAFAYENITLLQANQVGTAFAYIGASVLAGLFAVWLGLLLTR